MALGDGIESYPAAQARIVELEERLERYVLQQRVLDAKNRVRVSVLSMTVENDWPRIILDANDELSHFIEFNAFRVNIFDPGNGNQFFSLYEIHDGVNVDLKQLVPTYPALDLAFTSGIPSSRRSRSEINRLDGIVAEDTTQSAVDVPFSGGTISIISDIEDAFSEQDVIVVGLFCNVIDEAFHRLSDIRKIRRRDQLLHQKQHLESVGHLTAGVAHNFNNMLQGIMGNIYMAKMVASSEKQLGILAKSESAGLRAAQLVRQLILSVKPTPPNDKSSMDPTERIQAIIDLARSTFDPRIEVSVDIANDIPPINMDPSYFEQVILNILLNARDALTEGAQARIDKPLINVHMSVGRSNLPGMEGIDYLCVSIVDNGMGMDEVTRLQIYEPFFTTKSPDRGTGLGLSTVRSIVENQGGHIVCISNQGEGTSFRVFIKLNHSEVPKHTNEKLATILVVDDEYLVRDSTEAILKHHGFTTLTACDGQEAVERFRRHSPELVLLDLSMPKMSGTETFAAMRKINPTAKILIYTGDENELASNSFEDTFVIRKPYLASDLVKVIEDILGVQQEV